MEKEHQSSHTKTNLIIGGIVVLGVVLVTIFSEHTSSPSVATVAPATNVILPKKSAQTPTPTTSHMPPADTTKHMTSYLDGTYSATGSYMSPGGQDQIGITLTLKNDTVTDVSATPEAGDHTSARFQDKFISGYKTYVVGKNIADIHLTKVSGSSLTPKGFNDALAQIQLQAKA